MQKSQRSALFVDSLLLPSFLKSRINYSFLQNLEAEKQLKFFQGCVAAAFAERDHSIMEVFKYFEFWPKLSSSSFFYGLSLTVEEFYG